MPITDEEIQILKDKARQLRKDIIDTTVAAGGAHIGGALSMVEIMVILYYKYLDIRPDQPLWKDRDRVIVSKGHAGVGIALYPNVATCYSTLDEKVYDPPPKKKKNVKLFFLLYLFSYKKKQVHANIWAFQLREINQNFPKSE